MSKRIEHATYYPLPSERDALIARESSPRIATWIKGKKNIRMRGANGKQEVEIPEAAARLLADILAEMAKGNAVTIVPIHAEFTTQQSAAFLNVSRPFVIGLLDRGSIPCRKVGTHRRILFKDLWEYREKSRGTQKAAVDKLSAIAQKYKWDY